MKEAETNIWGKPGCELPNGRLCNACCVLPEIELEGIYVSLAKLANSPCPHLAGAGCDLHLNGKPDACKNWHCSNTGSDYKIDLIAQGLSSSLVTETEALSAAFEILRSRAKGNTLIYLIQSGVLDRSAQLSTITHNKDLVARDLDET